MIQYVKGDATNPKAIDPNKVVVIPHCCNSVGAWGSGFVMAISKKWKQPEQRYREMFKGYPNPLGTAEFVLVEKDMFVVNMIGQVGVQSSDNPYPLQNYKHLWNAMQNVKDQLDYLEQSTLKLAEIHCPKFGSGLAGGHWPIIEAMIEKLWAKHFTTVVYEF